MPPFFSIGVTTYNRIGMLTECLNSILKQTFTDFEVIVGNDFTGQVLTTDLLGVNDPRFRIINHDKNIGEIENMNALMGEGQGRYFSWLADDDMYFPEFLESVYDSLIKFDFPACVFTSYCHGEDFTNQADRSTKEVRLINGNQFLQLYLSRELKAIGCYGVFDKEYLKYGGGIEKLGDGSFHPYSDNLLAIKAGLLSELAYIDNPLIFYRTHEGSISNTSPDLNAYRSAQDDLCKRSISILKRRELKDEFKSNLFLLLSWCIKDFSAVVGRAGSINLKQSIGYLVFQIRYIVYLGGSIYCRKALHLLLTNIVTLIREYGFRRKGDKYKLIIRNKIQEIKNSLIKKRFGNNERAIKKQKYVLTGRKPWDKGYVEYKEDFLKEVLVNHKLLEKFKKNQEIPKGYGFRLDERVIEYPWVISRLTDGPAKLLDAGSSLIYSYLLNLPVLCKKAIIIYTLAVGNSINFENISYIRGDLRQMGLKEQTFEEIICISTLEHIGLDNTKIYIKNERYNESKPFDYRNALREFKRLLVPGGRLLITVPFGQYQNIGWLQQFDGALIEDVIKIFNGNIRDQAFYQYKPEGWIRSNPHDCQDCEYFDIHIEPGYDADYAAAARAVACMELIK